MQRDHELTFDLQRYIETPGMGYLNGINGTSLESLVRKTEEIARLKDHLSFPRVIVSVGVGQGEELHAIHMLYGGLIEKIIGVDFSQLALNATRQRALTNNLPVELKFGEATKLPLPNESVDGILLSSLLHEVYSYSPNGKRAWNEAIQESTRVVREGGYILIRDSAAPNLWGNIRVHLRTDLARQFYSYFGEEYRVFSGWGNLKGRFSSNLPPFPLLEGSDTVTLSIGQAAELLFHFVNFEMGYPNDQEFIGNQRWKELNEIYYIPQDLTSPEPMRINEYVAEVIKQANLTHSNTEFELVCAEMGYSVRPRMFRPLSEHFFLALLDSEEISTEKSEELLRHFIDKMELVFKKIRKESDN
ncbi:class I SAM-dependent methyltransferase [Candidatus Daviesbacteria bacterium]|nr:class I SAM-dependent methyltransferase [Candidatus Daviesbacteria bacterium]